ncbi:cholesterol 25-hydroxylase-like protein 1, member 1 [Spea bombifrons]|uniref:cholesterol 25-hydroxylase-like protein 1, member 1 n=1 Tax=Spea bombifrons TaxID=233779 RepID=UPI00234BA96B|nr:cholesterol 25-hydroxylase-like protein 1, member 1 [Spea bombifrons]
MNSTRDSHECLFLQTFWDYIIHEFGGLVTCPFFPVLLAFSGYICFSFPFALLDVLGEQCHFFYKYKIQKKTRPTVKMMCLCIWRSVFNHVVYVLPMVMLSWVCMPPLALPSEAPSVYTLFGEVFGCLLLFDFQYFMWHVLHHKNKWLYKKVHAVHHKYVAPFSWASQNLGGYELMAIGFWSNNNPIALGCHPLTSWICNLLSIWMSVNDHIGYDFPWSLSHILPFRLYGGALAHDLHHQRPEKNFAPFFSHWDLIFGTSCYIENSG